jgi:PAS domain S-box-containing protein
MNPDNQILASLIEGSPYPIYLIMGEELRITVANKATLKAWGKDESVIGKRFAEALPELDGQPFENLLRIVMLSGEPYYAVNDRADLMINGKMETSYYTFSYQPLFGTDNKGIGVICYATDVTGLVKAKMEVTEISEKATLTNDKLIMINEEMVTSNEEMAAMNEEIMNTNEELSESYNLLELSEKRFRNLILQAPFAICVIRAKDLIITDVNDLYLELVGKERFQLDGLNIWDGVPEAAEVYAPIMQEVVLSRSPYVAKEAEVYLPRKGKMQKVFIDFVYEPVTDLMDNVTAIMVVGIDVSEKVWARKKVEDVEERIRLAVEAAEIGTYDYSFENNKLITSDRFNEILGVASGADRAEVLAKFHPDDRHLSDAAHEKAKNTGRIFYEARLLSKDKLMKWVRFQASVYFDVNGNRERILGTVIDITEYKALQQQKDDFISIASHELKTPITSLKASLQLIARMKEAPNQLILSRMIDQATRSMDKITELIEDLLNVSKMNAGQIELRKDWFKVSDMLTACCNHVREIGKHELIIQGDKQLQIFADEHRVDQVVVNLVNNAVKYAPSSSEIFLMIEKLNNMVKVSVKDSGPGIAQEQLPFLFDRYFRADNSGMQVSGLGLGLYISADIVRRHGGEMGVESEIGKGSNFWFTLPIEGNS